MTMVFTNFKLFLPFAPPEIFVDQRFSIFRGIQKGTLA